MAQQLTADDFNHLVRYFKREAFRLEVRSVYLIDDEQDNVAQFLRGEPHPVTEIPFYNAWLSDIRAATVEGRHVSRVRILDDPLTDYQRWELWSGAFNIGAGETLNYLDRATATSLGLPLDNDWWLFDSERLAQMRFDPDGRPLGGTVVSDPDLIAQHCAWRDLAVAHSTPVPGCRTAPQELR